jgi:Pentapeptide repeats (8 copies)
MATFTKLDELQGAEFVDADLRGARFVRTDLSGVVTRSSSTSDDPLVCPSRRGANLVLAACTNDAARLAERAERGRRPGRPRARPDRGPDDPGRSARSDRHRRDGRPAVGRAVPVSPGTVQR